MRTSGSFGESWSNSFPLVASFLWPMIFMLVVAPINVELELVVNVLHARPRPRTTAEYYARGAKGKDGNRTKVGGVPHLA